MLRFLPCSLLLVITSLLTSACNTSDLKEAVSVADGVPRKTIDTDTLGMNAFANDARFGSPSSQFQEVSSTLGLRFVRILVRWDSLVQPSKGSALNLSFADTLLASIPADLDALIVMTGTPTWMSNPANWSAGDPRATFVEELLSPVVARYGNHPRVIGFQVWNEPNQDNTENQILGLTNSAALYVDMLKRSSEVIRARAPSKLVVGAATTAINQNYPTSLNYNRAMQDAGAQSHADIWAIHYYGRQFENVIRPGGIADFTGGLSLPIWITESGAQGVNQQLAYGEQVWPFLREKIPTIQRIYVYQFTEATPPDSTYGLKNLSADLPVSDLYVWLRDRANN